MKINENGARPLGLAAVAALALGTVALAPAAHAAGAPAGYRPFPTVSVANGTLTILGTGRDDQVSVATAADPAHVLVDVGDGAGPRPIDRSTFTDIAAFLGAGNDTFSVTGVVAIPMTVDGGAGDDTITGGAADDHLLGGRGDDTLLGGDGNDVILGGRGDDTVDGQRGADTEFLGRGDDRAAWLPGEGSDAIDGGPGNDTLVFDGAAGNERFGVTASGSHAVLTRDLGNIRMDTAGVEGLDLATLGGTDAVTVGDLSGTALRRADVDLGVTRGGSSDGQLDTVELDGSDRADRVDVQADGSAVDVRGLPTHVRVQGSDSRDQLQVDTGAGNDQVSVSDAARALIEVGVDLGAGQH